MRKHNPEEKPQQEYQRDIKEPECLIVDKRHIAIIGLIILKHIPPRRTRASTQTSTQTTAQSAAAGRMIDKRFLTPL